MSGTSDEILRVLGNTGKPMTASEILDAGNFLNAPLVSVTLHDMCTKGVNPRITRVKPADLGKFQYRLLAKGEAPPVKPVASTPKLAKPQKPAAPVNDDAYAAVLFDLRKKREAVSEEALKLAQEIHNIDAAIVAVEALT